MLELSLSVGSWHTGTSPDFRPDISIQCEFESVHNTYGFSKLRSFTLTGNWRPYSVGPNPKLVTFSLFYHVIHVRVVLKNWFR